MVLTGPRDRSHWQAGEPETADFYDLKGIVEGLVSALGLESISFEAAEHPTFRPGFTARLMLGKQQVGWLGELHPLVTEGFDIRVKTAVLAAELDMDALLANKPADSRIEPISLFPAVQEDLALLVDQTTTAAAVEEVIRRTGGFLLKSAELFDLYEGEQVGAGKKSLAYHLTFQSPSKTLTDKDVRKQRQRIIQQLEKRLGAKLR